MDAVGRRLLAWFKKELSVKKGNQEWRGPSPKDMKSLQQTPEGVLDASDSELQKLRNTTASWGNSGASWEVHRVSSLWVLTLGPLDPLPPTTRLDLSQQVKGESKKVILLQPAQPLNGRGCQNGSQRVKSSGSRAPGDRFSSGCLPRCVLRWAALPSVPPPPSVTRDGCFITHRPLPSVQLNCCSVAKDNPNR